MIGDRIIPKPFETNVARDLFGILEKRVAKRDVIAISGESGSGKTEIAFELSRFFEQSGRAPIIFQQDDYFHYPPKTNELRRRKDIRAVGLKEVNLTLLDAHLSHLKRTPDQMLKKPLVVFFEDRITQETIEPAAFDIAFAEGTYTSLLTHVDIRIFIDRQFQDTEEDRRQRRRDQMDSFVEKVLEIEHKIISRHKSMADLVVNKDFTVTMVNKKLLEGGKKDA